MIGPAAALRHHTGSAAGGCAAQGRGRRQHPRSEGPRQCVTCLQKVLGIHCLLPDICWEGKGRHWDFISVLPESSTAEDAWVPS